MIIPLCLTAFVIFVMYVVFSYAPQRKRLKEELHVFLDLKTFSTRPDATVLAIGAVCVNLLGEELDRVKILVNIRDAAKYGHTCPAIVEWWERQSPEAIALIMGKHDGARLRLPAALDAFNQWYESLGKIEGVWGDGATAGCVWLRSAYTAVGGEVSAGCPWDFWQERDCRTVAHLGWLAKLPNYKRDLPFIGTPHNCVDDASFQARYTVRTIRGLL